MKTIVAYTTTTNGHPLEALRLEGPISRAGLEFLVGNERADPHEVISTADIVVIQRDFPRRLDTYRQVMACVCAYHKPVVYEIDDLLWDLPKDHPYRQNHYFSDALVPMLLAALEADAITVSTPNLGDYVRSMNPNTRILPNYLDDQIWALRPIKPAQEKESPVVLGYIGPMGVHEQDLRTVEPALERILERYGNRVKIKFWGAKPPGGVQFYSNVEHVPLAMGNYRQFAAYCMGLDCDVFIAPLERNLFNQCKSPIKFLEYSALGVVGVYSRLAPYQAVVQHGENGFLADTADEWYEHLIELIENPMLCYEMSRRAQETVRDKWLLSNHAEEWVQVYDRIISSGQPLAHNGKYVGEHVVAAIAVQLAEWQQDKEKAVEALTAQIAPHASRRESSLSKVFRRARLWLAPSASRHARALNTTTRAWQIWRTKGVVALMKQFIQFSSRRNVIR